MDLVIARKLAYDLLDQHVHTGTYACGVWSVGFMTTRRTMGRCERDARVLRLASFWMPRLDEDKIREVILHEIAHILTPEYFASHGAEWKHNARAIGIIDPSPHVLVPAGHAKWIATCPECGKTDEQHRLGPVAKRGGWGCGECLTAYPDRPRSDFTLHYVQQH
jgi:predicted SprT family Zn-dependent metalloprotease